MKSIISASLLVILLLLTTGCDEEDIQYRTKSPDPIPVVPANGIAGAASPHGTADPGAQTPPVVTGLPDQPETVDFSSDATGNPPTGFGVVDLAGVKAYIPDRYRRVQSSSAMRIAQYELPAVAGGETGELVVFHFGAGQGGSAADNAARWVGQFRPPAGESGVLRLYTQDPDVNGLTVTRVAAEGIYTPTAMGPMAPPQSPREGWGLDALIVEGGPQGTVFLRWTAPRPLLAQEQSTIETIAETLGR